MLNSLSARKLTNVKVTIGKGEIICENVADTTQVHQLWAWAMSLLQTTPRTTLVLVEGIFKSTTGSGMVRIDKAHGVYLTWRTTAEQFGTEGWPDNRVRIFKFYKGVDATLYISIRESDQVPARVEPTRPEAEVLDFNTL